MELEQIQAQGGKAKRPAGSSGISAAKAKAAAGSGGSLGGKAKATAGSSGSGTKRKQSAAALNDNSNATDSMHSEKGKVRPRPPALHVTAFCGACGIHI